MFTSLSTADANATLQDEVVKSLEEARPLPPHHPDEQSPHKAYVLKELVGELMGALKTEAVLRAATDSAYREGDFTSLRVRPSQLWDVFNSCLLNSNVHSKCCAVTL